MMLYFVVYLETWNDFSTAVLYAVLVTEAEAKSIYDIFVQNDHARTVYVIECRSGDKPDLTMAEVGPLLYHCGGPISGS